MGNVVEMKETLFSVAMATYNGERFIKEQIDSILRQTIQNIEIVICDDCSTDSTWEILKEYAKDDFRFKIYRNETNLGFCKNFEKAISLCHGDYIALSDQDDVWMDNHIEVLLKGLGNKVMACGNALLVDEKGISVGVTWREMELLDYIPDDDLKKLKSILFFRNPYQGASMLFKRELLKFALPFPDGTLFHDRWLAIVSTVSGGISYVNQILLYYRRYIKNVTSYRSKRNRTKHFLHGWMAKNTEELDNLIERTKSILPYSRLKEIQKWRYIIKNNTKWRKPITISFLLKDFKNIYSYNFRLIANNNKHY